MKNKELEVDSLQEESLKEKGPSVAFSRVKGERAPAGAQDKIIEVGVAAHIIELHRETVGGRPPQFELHTAGICTAGILHIETSAGKRQGLQIVDLKIVVCKVYAQMIREIGLDTDCDGLRVLRRKYRILQYIDAVGIGATGGEAGPVGCINHCRITGEPGQFDRTGHLIVRQYCIDVRARC